MMWFKALHIIAVISWMAGLLYLPRLFVYHADVPVDGEASELFKIMERRLFRFIMTPAMVLAWLFGLVLIFIYQAFDFGAIWSWAKIALVIGLSGFHFWLGSIVGQFALDERPFDSRFFRKINEVPTLIMIFVVIFVVVRPF